MGDQCNFLALQNTVIWVGIFNEQTYFLRSTCSPSSGRLTHSPKTPNGYKSMHPINAYRFDQEPWWALGLIEPIF